MPRVLWGSYGGGRFLMSEVSLYLCRTQDDQLFSSRHATLLGCAVYPLLGCAVYPWGRRRWGGGGEDLGSSPGPHRARLPRKDPVCGTDLCRSRIRLLNLPHPGFRVQGSGFRVQGSGFRVQGSGFRVQGSGFRVQGSGFRVQGSGFRIQGSGFRVQGSGFRVQGSGPAQPAASSVCLAPRNPARQQPGRRRARRCPTFLKEAF